MNKEQVRDNLAAARSYRNMKLKEKDPKMKAWLKRMERREKSLALR